MTNRTFTSVITTATAIMAGLSLFWIATTGARAAAVHLWHGDIRPALLVGAIAALCLGASLIFLMPAQRRRIIAAGETPQYRQIVGFWASLILLAVLIGAAVLSKGTGDTVLGFVPRSVIFPASVGFALLFLVTFIFPGLAYRLSALPRTKPRANPRPAPELSWSVTNVRSPALRIGLRVLASGYAVLLLLAFCFWQFAQVIPDPAILDANRSWFALSLLLVSLPLAIPILRAPITGDATTWTDHLRAKWAHVLGVVMFNGLIVLVLPERGLPILANAALGAGWETRPYTVVSAAAKSGLRGCGARIEILLNPATGRTYGLCGIPKGVAGQARPGDTLLVLGRSAGYGLVIKRVMLMQGSGAPAPQP